LLLGSQALGDHVDKPSDQELLNDRRQLLALGTLTAAEGEPRGVVRKQPPPVIQALLTAPERFDQQHPSGGGVRRGKVEYRENRRRRPRGPGIAWKIGGGEGGVQSSGSCVEQVCKVI